MYLAVKGITNLEIINTINSFLLYLKEYRWTIELCRETRTFPTIIF